MAAPTIRVLRPGAGPQLVCLPFAAAAGHAFAPLGRHLGPGWQVLTVDPPGHGPNREPLVSDFEELLAFYRVTLAPVLREPFVLFGHSLGGLVAYRLTRELVAAGRAPAALVLSAVTPPGWPREALSRVPDAELVGHLLSLGGTDDHLLLHADFVSYVLPVMRADLRAVETFSAPDVHPLDLRTLLLAGSSDPEATGRAMARWRRFLPLAELMTIPGGHMFVVSCAAEVAAAVGCLL